MKRTLAALLAVVACGKAPEATPEPTSETAVTIPAAAPQPPATDAGVALYEAPEASAPLAPTLPTPPRVSGRVREGEVTVSSGLPMEVVRRILRQQTPRFRSCYESGLRANPSLGGSVTVRFTIKHDGSVIDARLDETGVGALARMGDALVERCVLTVFPRLSFPETTSGSVRVVYPLYFTQI